MDIVHAVENAKARSDKPVEDVKITASGEVSWQHRTVVRFKANIAA
jgi:hypothetical protein